MKHSSIVPLKRTFGGISCSGAEGETLGDSISDSMGIRVGERAGVVT